MKKLLFLMLFPAMAFGQFLGDLGDNYYGPLKTGGFNSGTIIFNKAYVTATKDTTEWINTTGYNVVELQLWTLDSAQILVLGEGSAIGGGKVTATSPTISFTVIDSLGSGSAGTGQKAITWINYYTTAKGAQYASNARFYPYVRFILDFDANVQPVGTTTPTYYAYILLKR